LEGSGEEVEEIVEYVQPTYYQNQYQ